jgi:hypothetical protein
MLLTSSCPGEMSGRCEGIQTVYLTTASQLAVFNSPTARGGASPALQALGPTSMLVPLGYSSNLSSNHSHLHFLTVKESYTIPHKQRAGGQVVCYFHSTTSTCLPLLFLVSNIRLRRWRALPQNRKSRPSEGTFFWQEFAHYLA